MTNTYNGSGSPTPGDGQQSYSVFSDKQSKSNATPPSQAGSSKSNHPNNLPPISASTPLFKPGPPNQPLRSSPLSRSVHASSDQYAPPPLPSLPTNTAGPPLSHQSDPFDSPSTKTTKPPPNIPHSAPSSTHLSSPSQLYPFTSYPSPSQSSPPYSQVNVAALYLAKSQSVSSPVHQPHSVHLVHPSMSTSTLRHRAATVALVRRVQEASANFVAPPIPLPVLNLPLAPYWQEIVAPAAHPTTSYADEIDRQDNWKSHDEMKILYTLLLELGHDIANLPGDVAGGLHNRRASLHVQQEASWPGKRSDSLGKADIVSYIVTPQSWVRYRESSQAVCVGEVKPYAPLELNRGNFSDRANDAMIQSRERVQAIAKADGNGSRSRQLVVVCLVGVFFMPQLFHFDPQGDELHTMSIPTPTIHLPEHPTFDINTTREQCEARGWIRPSNASLMTSDIVTDSRPTQAAFHDLRTENGKRVWQQMCIDIGRIAAGGTAQFEEMYGEPAYGATQRLKVELVSPGDSSSESSRGRRSPGAGSYRSD